MTATSSSTSTSPKTQSVSCPSGKVALSGGASLSSTDYAALTRSIPSVNGSGVPTGWTADAYRVGSTSWSLTVYAVCASVS